MSRIWKKLKGYTRAAITLSCIIIPSAIKIPVYRRLFGYQIGKHVKIGMAWINVGKLEMGDYSKIGHFTRLKNIPEVQMGNHSTIGFGITFTSTGEFTSPAGTRARGNSPRLKIGNHSTVTMLHYFDVQDSVEIGSYTTIAGRGSTFFTHYLDIVRNKQSAKPITIGDYCMVGACSCFVPGSSVPNFCVVGMASVVTRRFTEPYCLIAGNPAQVIKKLPEDAAYFHRTYGWVGEFAAPPPEIVELQREQNQDV